MAPPKFVPQNPNGRPKGVPNKATTQCREAISRFVNTNVHRLEAWLDKIAENDPEAAFKAFMSVVEFHIPKLARTEEVGNKNQTVIVMGQVTVDSNPAQYMIGGRNDKIIEHVDAGNADNVAG
jgi:hypothetical protein